MARRWPESALTATRSRMPAITSNPSFVSSLGTYINSGIRTVILAEAIILSAIGTSFGLLAGLYMGRMAVSAFALLGFQADYIFGMAKTDRGISILLDINHTLIPEEIIAGSQFSPEDISE